MRNKMVALVAVTLLVAACQQSVVVTVDQSGTSPIFSVARGQDEPCVDDLSVYAGEPEGTPVWHVAAMDGAPCTARFRFAATPPRFAADDGVMPVLSAGSRYTVVASGKGFLGGESFVARVASPR